MNTYKTKVIKVRQPIGDFYIASLPCSIVAQIATADVRRLEERDVEKYLGIQRPLKEDRVKELQKYVKTMDATFPTSVILAVDEKCASLNEDDMELTLSEYIDNEHPEDSIPMEQVAKIIDGQHRIASFVEIDKDGQRIFKFGDEIFDISVAILIGADISQQANIFSTVNLAQTKVNKSLAYDLADLAKYRSPQKTCHMISVMLDSREDSPFYQRIKRLGVKTQGRVQLEPLTQAVFVEALMKFISAEPMKDRDLLQRKKSLPLLNDKDLVKFPFRNLFIEEKDSDIAFIIYEYFSAIKSLWPKSWNDLTTKGNILPKSNAFRAFMRYLHEICGENLNKIMNRNDFLSYFNKDAFIDGDVTSQQFLPGSGGEAAFLKKLQKKHCD